MTNRLPRETRGTVINFYVGPGIAAKLEAVRARWHKDGKPLPYGKILERYLALPLREVERLLEKAK